MARKEKDGTKVVRKTSFKALFIVFIIGIALGVAGTIVVNRYLLSPETEVSVVVLKEELKNCSELATSKLDIVAEEYFENSSSRVINWKYITRKSFTMKYHAEVRAGVDLEKADISITGRVITVTLPSAEILGVTIDPDSLEFYDNKRAIFNWSKKEDAAEAQELAKKSALERAEATDLVDQANEQTRAVVENLFAPLEMLEDPYIVEVKISNSL
ncbi:MAG: DUF4230 domain-containing protein [Coriobacteriales bacterium]|nr:DUF4230 domain-containing protein [Coriobacteriales bacterium]